MAKAISQHKKLAMGESIGLKKGGKVPGMPMSPMTKVKRNNGIPGMKDGGMKKGGC